MHTRFASVVFAVVLAGCASKAPPQTSNASPVAKAAAPVATTAPAATQAPVAVATTFANPPKVEAPKATKLAVKRITIARGVENHEPKDVSDTVDGKADKVYAFVEVDNPQKLPGEITVEFQPPSKKYEGRITLGVGESSRWRTWAFTRQAHETGEWTAIVRDDRGHELAREKFTVTT
ncbi:MAG TPA: DUF2914 domain-containing protein [Polyangiaceae bacterium]|jgi:hypothetical protein|nr:DUF2914 domain-containing protein [Polyangiaceae bacterium]